MEFNGYRLKGCTKKDTYQYWTFIHKMNDSLVEIVTQDSDGNVAGKQEFINFLKTSGKLEQTYKVNKQLIKEEYERTIRSQTGHKMGRANKSPRLGD